MYAIWYYCTDDAHPLILLVALRGARMRIMPRAQGSDYE